MAITPGTTATIGKDANDFDVGISIMDNQASGKAVVTFDNADGDTDAVAQIVTVSGTTITAGTATTIKSNNSQSFIGIGLDSSSFATGLRYPNSGPQGNTNANTVSGTTITSGAFQIFYVDNAPTGFSGVGVTSTTWFIAYTKQSSSDQLWGLMCSRSGTTTTVGSEDQIATQDGVNATCLLDSTHVVVAYAKANDSNKGNAQVGTISGTTPTFTTDGGTQFTASAVNKISAWAMSSSSFVIAYNETTNNKVFVVGATVSGTTITWGTPVEVLAFTGTRVSVVGVDSTNFVVTYTDSNDSNKLKAIQGSLSGSTCTLDSSSRTTISASASWFVNNGYRATAPLGTAKMIFVWTDNTDGTAGSTKAVVADLTFAGGGPANLKSLDGNVKSNIKSFDGNLLANIKSIDGNA